MKVYRVGSADGFNVIAPVGGHPPPTVFDGTPLSTSWRPFEVDVVSPVPGSVDSDCPRWFGGVIVVSQRAISLLDEYLGEAEILPLCSRPNQFGFACDYSVVNVTRVIDCLDRANSILSSYPSTGRIMTIKRYSFLADRLRGISLFKIPEQSVTAVFVGDGFVEKYRSVGLEGLRFSEVFSTK